MKRTKKSTAQLSFLEPGTRWSDLPLDTRQKIVALLAQLLVHTPTSPPDDSVAPTAAREVSDPPQEN